MYASSSSSSAWLVYDVYAFRLAGTVPFFAAAAGFEAVFESAFEVAALLRGLERKGTSVLAAGFLGVDEVEGLLFLDEAK